MPWPICGGVIAIFDMQTPHTWGTPKWQFEAAENVHVWNAVIDMIASAAPLKDRSHSAFDVTGNSRAPAVYETLVLYAKGQERGVRGRQQLRLLNCNCHARFCGNALPLSIGRRGVTLF
jgi:hypothetical protein